MKSEEIIAQARGLLSEGKTADAKNLLLEKGYIEKSDAEIQKRFAELIPESPELSKEKQESLKKLFDADSKVRAKAADFIHRQALKSNHKLIESWQKDPRTIDILFDALADENPKVVAETTGALGAIARRYFRDLRIYAKLLEILKLKNKDAVYYAALHLDHYRIDSKWDELLEILEDKTTPKIAGAILGNINNSSEISQSRKEILKERLTKLSAKTKDEKIKLEIAQGIERLERFF